MFLVGAKAYSFLNDMPCYQILDHHFSLWWRKRGNEFDDGPGPSHSPLDLAALSNNFLAALFDNSELADVNACGYFAFSWQRY